jgi:hypothetical protein
MSEQENIKSDNPDTRQTSWGPYLFYGAFIAVLIFFWWMVIYPHGVAPHK